jgi:5-methylcytosine-specific restriction endonuclease McrA
MHGIDPTAIVVGTGRVAEVIVVEAVLVLNADCGPLHRVSLRHAIRMLFREVAVVHEAEADRVIGIYPMPTVVRLVSRWRYTGGPSWSRRGLMARDGRRCAYCHGHANTVDHIVPRSRGGKDSWLNTVAACATCNHRKGSRTPAEARMPLLVKPYVPSWAAVTHI